MLCQQYRYQSQLPMSIYLRRKNTVNYYLDLDINCITYSTLIRDVIMYTIIIYTITV